MSDYRGYSLPFAMLVKSADPNKIGVQLGLLCIEKNIPAQEIAQHFFVGQSGSVPEQTDRMRAATDTTNKLIDLCK